MAKKKRVTGVRRGREKGIGRTRKEKEKEKVTLK